MKIKQDKIRILFFIGSLSVGGKERRLIELLTYLKRAGNYDMLVLVTTDLIQFPNFIGLGIPYRVLPKLWQRNDPTVIFQFYRCCKLFKPDLIHSWGQMQSFYTLPTIALESIPLINSQITSAPPTTNKFSFSYILDRLIFKMSTVILSNSKAGLKSFKPPMEKSRVVYNGLNFGRFENLENVWKIKNRYGIKTEFAVIMVASVSPNKNYKTFFEVGQIVTKERDDITFIGVGRHFEHDPAYRQLKVLLDCNKRLLLKGNISDVEHLVNACDLGILLSPNGEGMSNAILEYMALGKPIIASNKGGNPEIIKHGVNGYLVQDDDLPETIASYVIELINNKRKRIAFGEFSRKIIYKNFSIDSMGYAFEKVYQYALLKKSNLDFALPANKE